MSQIGNFETLIGRKSVFLDFDWSRIGTFEPLIGSCAVREVRLWKFLMAKYQIMLKYEILACQVGPFRLKLPQINSEMNCIAKNKCALSQKLHTRRIGEKLNATAHVSYVTFCVFALFYVIQEKRQKI